MKLGCGFSMTWIILWNSILRSKDVRSGGGIYQEQAKRTDSPLQKAICKVWPQVPQGVSWAVRNGRKARFWSDVWLEGYGPLADHACSTQPIPEEIHKLKVADMVTPIQQWRWVIFAHLLPMQLMMVLLASYPPPNMEIDDDKVFRQYSSSGVFMVFTVKSAYKLVQNHQLGPLWRLVWDWKGLERIRMFIC